MKRKYMVQTEVPPGDRTFGTHKMRDDTSGLTYTLMPRFGIPEIPTVMVATPPDASGKKLN